MTKMVLTATTRNLLVVSSLIVGIAFMIMGYFAWLDFNRTDVERADRFAAAFQSASTPQEWLDNLAGLFGLQGENHVYSNRAVELFNSLQPEQQLELFTPTTLRSMKEDQLTVALNIYQSLGFTAETDPQGNNLLAKMRDAMSGEEDAPELEQNLEKEITLWLEGSDFMQAQKYADAKVKFSEAILENPKNPALYYDLAHAYMEMGRTDTYNYRLALATLETMLQLEPSRNIPARLLIEKNAALSQYWSQYGNSNEYPMLAKNIIKFTEFADEKGASMILIPEGVFSMGSDTGYDNEKPVHEVYLSSYYMDQYEVSNAAYKLCVDAGVCQPLLDASSATRASYYGNSQFDNYPVINVDWNMSNAYCKWRRARLPTEAEWEKAARGADGSIYPWGEIVDCTYANFWGSQNGACVGDTTSIGSYASGQSPYGVYDMAGNVEEWVNDWYQDDYYAAFGDNAPNPQGPSNSDMHALRGGSWNDVDFLVRSAIRSGETPDNFNDYVGFRCARDISQ